MHSGKKVSRRIKASSKVRGYFCASFFPKVARVISNAVARSAILSFFLAISHRRFSYSMCAAGNFSPRFLLLFHSIRRFLLTSGYVGGILCLCSFNLIAVRLFCVTGVAAPNIVKGMIFMWFIPFAVSLGILLFFILMLSLIYRRTFESDMGFFLKIARSEILLETPALDFQPKFMDIKCNLILKYVIFVIVGLIVHFTGSAIPIWIVYPLYTFVEAFKVFVRVSQFAKAPHKKYIASTLFSYILLFVFQILLNISVYFVYIYS